MAWASRQRRRDPDLQPTFFIDRGLGKRHVPSVLEASGVVVVQMSALYPGGRDQFVGDDTWIADVSARGWVALTKDVAIVRAHQDALRESTLAVFALSNANLTGPEMAERFRHNLHRILRQARKPGPFVDVVHADRVERRWPR